MAILDKALIFFNNAEFDSVKPGALIDLGKGGDAIGQELTLTITAISGGTMGSFRLLTSDNPNIAEAKDTSDQAGGCLLQTPDECMGTAADPIMFQCRVPKGAKRYLALLMTGEGGGYFTAYLSKEL